MVRYEVGRAGSADRREMEELREKVKKLEERMGGGGGGDVGVDERDEGEGAKT